MSRKILFFLQRKLRFTILDKSSYTEQLEKAICEVKLSKFSHCMILKRLLRAVYDICGVPTHPIMSFNNLIVATDNADQFPVRKVMTIVPMIIVSNSHVKVNLHTFIRLSLCSSTVCNEIFFLLFIFAGEDPGTENFFLSKLFF